MTASLDMIPDNIIRKILFPKPVYISGPMTGLYRYNFDEFYACEQWLTEHGIESHNPARVDEEQYGFDPNGTCEEQGFDIHAALTRDIEFIVSDKCGGVVVLPGWEQSTGAKWEVGVAQAIGKPVQAWTHTDLIDVTTPVKCSANATGALLDPWAQERQDLLKRFAHELSKATGDGSKKRQAGEKPPWYQDDSHEGAIFSHLTKWKRGETADPDSGAHPLVHAAWRCLAIACKEGGNTP